MLAYHKGLRARQQHTHLQQPEGARVPERCYACDRRLPGQLHVLALIAHARQLGLERRLEELLLHVLQAQHAGRQRLQLRQQLRLPPLGLTVLFLPVRVR